MLGNQLVQSRRPDKRLVRQNDECSFGLRVHGGESRPQGSSHTLLIVLINDYAHILRFNFLLDCLRRESQHKNDFPHPGGANVVQYVLQQRPTVQAQNLFDGPHSRGSSGCKDYG